MQNTLGPIIGGLILSLNILFCAQAQVPDEKTAAVVQCVSPQLSFYAQGLACKQALNQMPENPLYQFHLFRAKLWLASPVSTEMWQIPLEQLPKGEETWLLAFQLFEQRGYASAREFFLKLKNSQASTALRQDAQIAIKLCQMAEAEQDPQKQNEIWSELETWITTQENSASLWYQFAAGLSLLGQHFSDLDNTQSTSWLRRRDEAINRSLMLKKEAFEPRLMRLNHMKTGDDDGLNMFWQEAKALEEAYPQFGEVYAQEGIFRFEYGYIKRAIDVFHKVREENVLDLEVYWGSLLFRQMAQNEVGKHRDVTQELERLFAEKVWSPCPVAQIFCQSLYTNYAEALLLDQQAQKALNLLSESQKLFPELPGFSALNYKAWAYLFQADSAQASAAFLQSLRNLNNAFALQDRHLMEITHLLLKQARLSKRISPGDEARLAQSWEKLQSSTEYRSWFNELLGAWKSEK